MRLLAHARPSFTVTALASVLAAGALVACNQSSSSSPKELTPVSLSLEKIGNFAHKAADPTNPGAAEISAFDPLSKRLFVVNGAQGTVDVLDLTNPTAPMLLATLTSMDLGSGLGGANSIAVHNGVVAIAVEAAVKQNNGSVIFYRASDLTRLATVTVGALPDMLTFTPDGKNVVVANEGEPNSYGQPTSVDPVGSISVIRVSGVSPTASSLSPAVTQITFDTYNTQKDALQAAGVRLFGPGASVAQDLEPEYVTVSPDSRTAFVTLQENNAVAEVNLVNGTITQIRSLGTKNHNVAGAGMDVSNEDGSLNTNSGMSSVKIAPVPIKGLYMPDAIASYSVNGTRYLITANEGDAREYVGINAGGREDPRVREWCTNGLDPMVFTDAVNQIFDSNLGRLRVTAFPNGNNTGKNAMGQCSELYSFGSRSFSIWNATSMTRVYDSGDQFEQLTKALPNAAFNTSHDNNTLDDRSPAKGPEPESVTIGSFGDKTYAFIGLERVGGVMVYDVTDPAAATYVTYLNTRTGNTGDLGPEGLTFVAADKSPNGKPLLVVANEISGTTAILQINLAY